MSTIDAREGVERAGKIRAALLYLVKNDKLTHGDMSRIAEHFGVSRERVRQLKDEVLDEYQKAQLAIRPTIRRVADDTPLGVTRGG